MKAEGRGGCAKKKQKGKSEKDSTKFCAIRRKNIDEKRNIV
jgi:hypothetical protein